MWAPASSPDRGGRPKSAKNNTTAPSSPVSSSAPHPTHNIAIADLLEPAIDGPPSPESIRAFNRQMMRSTVLDKHQSHQTSSSGSSSLRSLASADRPAWEQALDGLTLSRNSSGRSTNSNVLRPDSVQIFGKTLFNRRTKIRRDSGAPSSSSSSLYSAEMPFELAGQPPLPAPTSGGSSRDNFIPAFFNRRRAATKPETGADELAARRKLQISGPYDFKHLTHTEREHVPNLQRGSRMVLQSEFSAMRAAQTPTDGTLKGIQAESLHFADFSSEALPLPEETGNSPLEPHTRISLSRPVTLRQHSSPPRPLPHASSQEVLRVPPPRPPRSPIEPAFVAPPVPPPRVSSRASIRYDGFDPLASTTLDRPQTSGGFRQPTPLAISPDGLGMTARNGHGYSHSADFDSERRYSRVIMTSPDDANWPLTCSTTTSFEKALPDVPEEEEHVVITRKSRISIASNTSSLRGSQSLPLLRQIAQSQAQDGAPQRPLSGGSDTLGRTDWFATQRALRAGMNDSDGPDALPRESWEEDIDYCYDHAAEADCDYAWDRPSMDLCREDSDVTPVEFALGGSPTSEGGISPAMLTPGRFDIPALSPASPVSAASANDAVTPTASAMPHSNFSLPRSDGRLLHIRTASHASSFKESHGFNLSPSLLIPGSDYHRQMMAHEGDTFPAYEEPTLTMDTSTLLIQSRTSASTTGSNDSEHSGSERHISTASVATDLTRLTMSTSSIDMDDFIPKNESSTWPSQAPESGLHNRVRSETMAAVPEEPVGVGVSRRNFSRSHSDPKLLSLMTSDATAAATATTTTTTKGQSKSQKGSIRRGRARTIGTPPPGQYALFPNVW